jgi:pSer/pThr/pTyr-binding forkhead associated (FHA) protein/NADPH-dependent 2,4-dienoyl-CoA reductase/sulfur reductase-like enzyme
VTRYAIIGDGAAGTTAAFYIRRADPNGRVIILSDDPQAAYYRAALTNFLIGELREEQLFAVPPNFYTEFRVERFQARVARVDTATNTLLLASGGQLPYDQLLIAAGANPNLPPWPGADLSGVMTMRTMQDARVVLDGLAGKQIKRAVVVGAGPLGIEWVQGMRNRGVEVTYVIRGDMFMEGILDRTASDLVWSRLRAGGVDLRLNEEITEVLGTNDRRVRAVRLKNGQEVPCELVGSAIGIRANTEFLQGSGVATERGVPVDEAMRTNVANVFAAGDIAAVMDPATGKRKGFGLWEPARLQGRTAGINMSGGTHRFTVGVQYNATRLWDLDLGAIGRTIEAEGDQVIPDFPRTGREIRYRKLILRDGKLVGALMLGHRLQGVRARALAFQRLISLGLDVSAIASGLLDPRFDLASWMDEHDPEIVARGSETVAAQQVAVPTNSELRRGSVVMSVQDLGILPKQETPELTLTVQGGQAYRLTNPITTIGRHPENDIVLDDEYVSSHHAQVRLEVNAFMLSDVGSRNGTFLNGVPVIAPTPLRQGDVARVGETNLTATLPASQVAPSAGFGAQQAQVGPPAQVQPASAGDLAPAGVHAPTPVRTATVMMAPPNAVLGWLDVAGRRVDLAGQTLNIGRDPGSEIPIDDPAVSYTHAQITRLGNDLYLRDVGSRNGTYVNAQLVSVPHLLREGDVIHVGTTDATFHGTGAAPAPPPQEPSPAYPPAAPAGQPPVPGTPAAPPPPIAGTPAPPPPAPGAPLLAPAPPQPPTAPMPPVPPGAPLTPPQAPAMAPQPPAPPTPGGAVPGPAGPTRAAPAGPRLVVVVGSTVGLSFALVRDSVRVGRDPSSDIVLRDQTVSRNHATLDRRGNEWSVTDLGSTNGTEVGGRRLAPTQATTLRPGDTVGFGDVECRFEVG